jgi:hypothetical protein
MMLRLLCLSKDLPISILPILSLCCRRRQSLHAGRISDELSICSRLRTLQGSRRYPCHLRHPSWTTHRGVHCQTSGQQRKFKLITKWMLSGHIIVHVVFVSIVQRSMLEATSVLPPCSYMQFRSCGDYLLWILILNQVWVTLIVILK